MSLILLASKYLKQHPYYTGIVLFSIITASFFEGATFGMLIPLIQSMITEGANSLKGIPFLDQLNLFFLSKTRLTAISLIFIILFFIIVIKNIFIYLSNVLIARLRFGLMRNLKVDLMNRLIEYDMKYYDGIKTGYIVSNINEETFRIGDFIAAALHLIALSARVLAYIILLFLISWKVSLIAFLLIAIVLGPLELIMKRVKKLGTLISKGFIDYNYKLMEILGGIRLIKGCGTEELEKRKFKATADELFHLHYKNSKYVSLIIPLSEIMIFALIVICFLALINIIKIDIKNLFPYIAAYLLVLVRMLTQLNTLNSRRSEAMNKMAAIENYNEICDEKGKRTINSGNKTIEKFTDSIEFRNVEFSYTSGKEVLRNIDIKILQGRMTAIVGESGVGKSTMVNLIPRFYEANSGKILVDGIDIKELDIKAWRQKIGLVSQDTFIFNMSVRDNISYGQTEISDEEVRVAAKAANADEFIMKMPDKYDTILGERGVKLSGGQKQRISIARAIIHNPEILILDEATSSLDTETERLIKEAIDKLTKNRTVIAIAHRLSTILHADNIIVMDGGTVTESGSHSELIAKGGLYKKLYDVQFAV